jgi:hypothetical protein
MLRLLEEALSCARFAETVHDSNLVFLGCYRADRANFICYMKSTKPKQNQRLNLPAGVYAAPGAGANGAWGYQASPYGAGNGYHANGCARADSPALRGLCLGVAAEHAAVPA